MATMENGTATSGKTFKEGDDIDIFLERLEQYFVVYDIHEENKQISTLLIRISEATYKILKSLTHPELPKDKTWEDLTEILRLRFRPRKSIFRMRIIFEKLCQGDGELVSKWYTRIREAAAGCEFDNYLEERIRDKFVTGMAAGPIQERLCEENVTKEIKDLVDIALGREATLQGANGAISVHQLKSSKPTPKQHVMTDLKCVHCGKGNHSFAKCKYKEYKCKLCKKVGHLAVVCKSKKQAQTHVVEADNEEEATRVVDIL